MSVKVLSNGRALVRLAEGAEVYFRGQIRVAEVICGSLQVLGSTIDSKLFDNQTLEKSPSTI